MKMIEKKREHTQHREKNVQKCFPNTKKEEKKNWMETRRVAVEWGAGM